MTRRKTDRGWQNACTKCNVGVEGTSFVFVRRNSRFWEVCIRNDVTVARYITQAMGRQKNIWTFSIDRHPVKVGANACITLRSGILNRVFPLSIIFYEYIMNEPCNILRTEKMYEIVDHRLDSRWKRISFSIRVKSWTCCDNFYNWSSEHFS